MTINPKLPASPKCETPTKETNPKSDAGKSSNQDDFSYGLAAQLFILASHGKHFDEAKYKFMLSFVNGHKRDAKIDAMLSVQMVAVHSAFVRIESYLAHSETLARIHRMTH